MKELYLDGRLFNGTEKEFLAVEKFHYKKWRLNGERHRDDGPAIIYDNGTQCWYINGVLHREDGPAVIHSNGYQAWYQYDKLHRIDGPAIIRPNGHQEYWLNGKQIHKTHFYKIDLNTKTKNLKTGVWLPISEAPDDFNSNLDLTVMLYPKPTIFGNAYKIGSGWWIYSGNGFMMINEPISFFIIPGHESSKHSETMIRNIISILDSD